MRAFGTACATCRIRSPSPPNRTGNSPTSMTGLSLPLPLPVSRPPPPRTDRRTRTTAPSPPWATRSSAPLRPNSSSNRSPTCPPAPPKPPSLCTSGRNRSPRSRNSFGASGPVGARRPSWGGRTWKAKCRGRRGRTGIWCRDEEGPGSLGTRLAPRRVRPVLG